jgi:hypothetical protein
MKRFVAFATPALVLVLGLGGSTPMVSAQEEGPFNGLYMDLGNLPRLSKAKSRSISPENFTGEKGKGGMATEGTGAHAARELGQGWKISPSVQIEAGKTFTLADIQGPGAIQQIWMTPTGNWRYSILRFYWDGETTPSVEVPVGDFFASGWGRYAQVNSMPVTVNPGSAFNCYWVMPFRKSARITLENIEPFDDASPTKGGMKLYYQVNYTLTSVPEDAAYFHAQFRRTNPVPFKQDYTLVDGIKGQGHYVGTYMAWGSNGNGWWGEGEIKFFMDGDQKFPTIVGTGTEDYFLGSYGFRDPKTRTYLPYSTPYAGMPQVIQPDGTTDLTQLRFGLYRWHVMDPVRFEQDLKVTMQVLGWIGTGPNRRYLPLQDDVASVAFWYQKEPHAPFPKLPDRDQLSAQ